MTTATEEVIHSTPLFTQFENIVQLGEAYFVALTKNTEKLDFPEWAEHCSEADYNLQRQLKNHSITDADAKSVVAEFRSWARAKECLLLSKKQENQSQEFVRILSNGLEEKSTNLNLAIAHDLFIAYGRLDEMLKLTFEICEFNQEKEKVKADADAFSALQKSLNERLRALMCSPVHPPVVETKLPESSERWQPIETAPEGNEPVTVFNPEGNEGGEVVQAVLHRWEEEGETHTAWLTADYRQLSNEGGRQVPTRIIQPTLWRVEPKPQLPEHAIEETPA